MSNKYSLAQKLADNSFFKIYYQTEIGNSFDSYLSQDQLKKIDKNQLIRQYGNNSKITPENWGENKDIFFEQRMEMYDKSYTLVEKIKLEIKTIKKLSINNIDYQILKDRYNTYLKSLIAQPINYQSQIINYKTKHYVLAYLFDCNARGESFPIGNKKKLEHIGNKRMEKGKGNRFYKIFNEIINKDLNSENILIEIGGKYWRKALLHLSQFPESVEQYLQKKQL